MNSGRPQGLSARLRRAVELFDLAISPFGGWPVVGAVIASVWAFLWGLMVEWGPATVPAVITAAGAGAITVDAVIDVVRKARVRFSRNRRVAIAIYEAYIDGREISGRLQSDEIGTDEEFWDVVAAWDTKVNKAASHARAEETAGLWTINLGPRGQMSRSDLEHFVQTKNEAKLRHVMLRSMKDTGLRGTDVLGDYEQSKTATKLRAREGFGAALDDIMPMRRLETEWRNKAMLIRDNKDFETASSEFYTLRNLIVKKIRAGISKAEAETFETVGNLNYSWNDGVNEEHNKLVAIATRDLDYLLQLYVRCSTPQPAIAEIPSAP